MAERLMGIETEYAISCLQQWGGRYDQCELVNLLLGQARKKLVHLPDMYSGLYLSNASRFYLDYGNHPELSTPECANPWDIVRYILAGERILAGLVEDMKPELAGSEVMLFKSNVDYGGTWATWGCHESYLHSSAPNAMSEAVIPHLVTRIIYTGAGGFDSISNGLEFTLSPRVPHLANVVSNNSTSDRGIFHTKDESLSKPGFHRLHIICGESLCSETSMWLKAGTTALVVAMAEAGLHPGRDVKLRSPLSAMQAIARDQTCCVSVELNSGRRISALEIQYHYLTMAEEHLSHASMPPWAEEVCRHWRITLNKLLAPELMATTLDWAIKRELYADYAVQANVPWASLEHWTRVLSELRRELELTNEFNRVFCADLVLEKRSPLRSVVKRLTPFLQEHGLSWDLLHSVFVLRRKLFEIDTRFGQLSGKGIFSGLDAAGVLTHHVPGVEAIDEAMSKPPSIGRARIRGEVIARLAAQEGNYQCDWQGVADITGRRVLDLSEPFESEERWLEVGQSPYAWPSVFYDLLTRLSAEASYRQPAAQPDGWPGRL